ncbi:MAG TPA: hypothetical protein ENG30_02930 [Thermofilaceae archaeon]|nr:hypothetical protein [Thermofilaceae archaeon]
MTRSSRTVRLAAAVGLVAFVLIVVSYVAPTITAPSNTRMCSACQMRVRARASTVSSPSSASGSCVIAFDEVYSTYTISNGKLTALKNLLESGGFTVVRNTDPITIDVLRRYDVFVMVRISGDNPPSRAELDAIIQYLNEGGNVVIMGGYVPSIQYIADYFGFQVGDGYVGEVSPYYEGYSTWIKCVNFNQFDPITRGVRRVMLYDAGFFVVKYYAPPNPNFVGSAWLIYTSEQAWQDANYNRVRDSGEPDLGRVPVALSASTHTGKLVMMLDSDIFTNDDTDGDGTINLYEYDNSRLALNLFRELCMRCINDRDCDGVPDPIDKCPDDPGPVENCGCPCTGFAKVDVVFVIDTSGSMNDEWGVLCGVIDSMIRELRGYGLDVQYKIYGLGHTRDCAREFIMSHEEDWGPGVAWVASNYPWRSGAARVIIPMSDEGPYHGCPVDSSDRSSISDAIAACQAAGAKAFPILGHTPYDCTPDAWTEMLRLASGTGGKAFKLSDPAKDVASAIRSAIVHAACDRDGDGVVDCEDACPETPGVPPNGCPGCDRDGDGVDDCNDKCPFQPGPPPDGCPVFFAFATQLGMTVNYTFDNIPLLFATDTKIVFGYKHAHAADTAAAGLLEYAAGVAGMDPFTPVFDKDVIDTETLVWKDNTSNLICVGAGGANKASKKVEELAGISWTPLPRGVRLEISGLGSWDMVGAWAVRDIFVVAIVHESGVGVDRNLMVLGGATRWGTIAACTFMSDPHIWSRLEGKDLIVGMWDDTNRNGMVDPPGVDSYKILATRP